MDRNNNYSDDRTRPSASKHKPPKATMFSDVRWTSSEINRASVGRQNAYGTARRVKRGLCRSRGFSSSDMTVKNRVYVGDGDSPTIRWRPSAAPCRCSHREPHRDLLRNIARGATSTN